MVYARHRRRSKRPIIHSTMLKRFVAAQDARLDEAAVKASSILTAATIQTTGTVTIGSKVYTFQDTLTNVDGNVKRSGTLATDLASLLAAINLGAGSGTAYAAAMTLHPTVEGVSSDATTLTARAKTGGTAGNAIATSDTLTSGSWTSTVMAGGLEASDFDVLDALRRNTAQQIMDATDKDNLA
jgi:hypothetical protein